MSPRRPSPAERNGPITASAAAHCATRSAYGEPTSARGDTKSTEIAASGGSTTGSVANVEQSSTSAAPSTPLTQVNWSRIPDGKPVAACSARWHSWASATADPSNPNANATATSSAALDDNPAPMGMVVDTAPTNPGPP